MAGAGAGSPATLLLPDTPATPPSHSHLSPGQTILAQLALHHSSVTLKSMALHLGPGALSESCTSLTFTPGTVTFVPGMVMVPLGTAPLHLHFVAGQKAPNSLAHWVPHHSELVESSRPTHVESKAASGSSSWLSWSFLCSASFFAASISSSATYPIIFFSLSAASSKRSSSMSMYCPRKPEWWSRNVSQLDCSLV